MKNVKLTQLNARNFKAQKNLSIDFTNKTQINGKNGSGKTTVLDAYIWALYGKDSAGRSDFNVKTLDKFGEAIPKIEHEVEIVFDIDGEKIAFKRVLVEKWSKRRGDSEETLTGHETKFFLNDVPKSKRDYETKVSEILPEEVFRMASNVVYFNEELHWKDRRSALQNMTGDISSWKIIEALEAASEDVSEVIELLEKKVVLSDEKLRIKAELTKIGKEADSIPARIDEVDRSKPEAKDWKQIELSISEKQKRLNEIESLINDSVSKVDIENKKVAEAKSDKFKKEQKLQDLKNKQALSFDPKADFKKQLQEKRNKLFELEGNSSRVLRERSSFELEIERINKQLEELRGEYKKKQAEQFDASTAETVCPTCKREHDNATDIVETLRSNFNTLRSNSLSVINSKGGELKTRKETLESKIKELIVLDRSEIDSLKLEIETLELEIKKPVEQPQPTQEMIDLQKEIESIVIPEAVTVDNSQLISERLSISSEVKELERQLMDREKIEKADKRINELRTEQATISQREADLKKIDHQIRLFEKFESEMIESRVNEMFDVVTFKMFEQKLNGNFEPTCVCMVDGVPYSDLNTASQINAGLDIVNTIQKFHEVNVPVFIDRRESVTTLIESNSQIITLKVDESAQSLKIINLD